MRSEVAERIEFRFGRGQKHGRQRRIVAKCDSYLRTDWIMLTRDGRGEWIQSVVKVLVYERGLKRLNGSPR